MRSHVYLCAVPLDEVVFNVLAGVGHGCDILSQIGFFNAFLA